MNRSATARLCKRLGLPVRRSPFLLDVLAADETERLCALTLNRLDALDRIQALMNGREWSADTHDAVAEELRRVGYAITGPV
jgi:hypothetical protein